LIVLRAISILLAFASQAIPAAETASRLTPLRAAVSACESRIDAQVDVGYTRIAARCPQLMRVLESGEWTDWLPRTWREPNNDLSIGGLTELASMIETERSRQRTGPRPGTAKLHGVLERLETSQAVRRGAWDRFNHWLDGVARQQPEDPFSGEWFERLLERATPTQLAIELASYVAVVAIIVLALTIVVNEVRAALALRRPRKRKKTFPVAASSADGPLTVRQVEEASLEERPALLLRLVFERLARAGRLVRADSLTIREAQARAALSDPADAQRLAELASVAEHVRYGARPAATGMLARALEAGTTLLAKLESAKAQPS
jgi:hypothetical protein